MFEIVNKMLDFDYETMQHRPRTMKPLVYFLNEAMQHRPRRPTVASLTCASDPKPSQTDKFED